MPSIPAAIEVRVLGCDAAQTEAGAAMLARIGEQTLTLLRAGLSPDEATDALYEAHDWLVDCEVEMDARGLVEVALDLD